MPHVLEGSHWMNPWGSSLRRLGLAVVLGMLLFGGGVGQKAWAQRTHLALHSKSQFWIQGEASTIDFTCKVSQVEGEAALPTTQSALSS